MDKGITVKKLLDMCNEQVKKGNGNKHILISDDDEGNGFHTLFYGISDDKESCKYAIELSYDDHDVNDIVVLGWWKEN